MKKALILALLAATLPAAEANDPSISLAATTPVNQFDRLGGRFYAQQEFGRHFNLALGYSQAEQQAGVSQGSVISRFAVPFQSGLRQRWYPFVGLDLMLDQDAPDAGLAPFYGAGFEQRWVNRWGGFAEVRYQTGRAQDWHLALGLRFWPGRSQELDARMRRSDPVRAADDAGFDGRIELTPPASPTQPVEATAQAVEDPPENTPPAAPEVESIVVPASRQRPLDGQTETAQSELPEPDESTLAMIEQATAGLPAGTYLQLGFFRQPESIQRFRSQVVDQSWASELRLHHDDRLDGMRVLLGPYPPAEIPSRREALIAAGQEVFVYRVPESPAGN